MAKQIYYTNDVEKFNAKQYQIDAFNRARHHYKNGNKAIFQYVNGDIKMHLIPLPKGSIDGFTLMTESGTFAYLIQCSSTEQYIRHLAVKNHVIDHMGGSVSIVSGTHYYTGASGKVVIGWHGTYDPPSDTTTTALYVTTIAMLSLATQAS